MDITKIVPSFDNKRSVLGEVLPLKTPFNVIIDTSERCNFQCKYCFRSDADKDKWGYAKNNQLMEWDIFIKIVEQVKEFEDVAMPCVFLIPRYFMDYTASPPQPCLPAQGSPHR